MGVLLLKALLSFPCLLLCIILSICLRITSCSSSVAKKPVLLPIISIRVVVFLFLLSLKMVVRPISDSENVFTISPFNVVTVLVSPSPPKRIVILCSPSFPGGGGGTLSSSPSGEMVVVLVVIIALSSTFVWACVFTAIAKNRMVKIFFML